MTNELTTDEVKQLAEACGLGLVKPMYDLQLMHCFDEEMNRYCIFDPINNDADNHKVFMAFIELCKVKSLHLEIRPSFAMHKLRITSTMEDEVSSFDEFNNHSIARALLTVLKIK